MKVVILCAEDYANLGYNLAAALNAHTTHTAACVTRNRHQFGYPHGLQIDRDPAHLIDEWTTTADVVIVKDDRLRARDLGVRNANPLAKTIVTVEGILFRDNRERHGRELFHCANARVAWMADVNYPEIQATYIPAPHDTDAFGLSWRDEATPVIAHSPSGNRRFKGTDDVFLPAIDRLRERGHHFEIDVISGVRWRQCMARKSRATIFFDQADPRIGTYGVSSIEAMSYGIPTVSYLSAQSVAQASGIHDDCPIVNAKPTIESVANALESLLTNDLKSLSSKTREWCVATHGFRSVASRWDSLLGSLT